MFLVGNLHVEDGRAGGVDEPQKGPFEILLLRHRLGLPAEAAGDHHEIGIAALGRDAVSLSGRLGIVDRPEVGVGPIPLEEAVLPLHDHAEVLVVEEQHLDRDVLTGAGGEFLDVHEDAAVAVDVDDERVGVGHLGSHRGWEAEAHRPQAARRDPRPRPAELVELGGPHLVLADPDGDDRVALGRQPRQLRDRLLGEDAGVVGVESERVFPLPFRDPVVPGAEIGGRCLDDLVELPEGLLDVGHDRDVDDLVLVDFGRIDVDVDDESMLGEGRHFPGDPVVEADAEGEEEIGLVDGVVGVDAAVHAEHVERERVVGRIGPEPHEGHRHRDPGASGELAELLGGTGGDHAAAGVDHGALGTLDRRGHLGDLLRMGPTNLWPIAGQVHRCGVIGNELRDLDVLGEINEHGAGAAGGGDVEGLAHHAGDVGRIGDEVVVLRDPTADLHHRGFLEGVGADDARADLAGEDEHRDAVELRVGDRRDEVEGSGAAGAHADADPPGRAGVALGRECPPLLVAGEDRPDPIGVAGERLVEGHARPARIGEDDIDAVGNERLDHHVGTANHGVCRAGT